MSTLIGPDATDQHPFLHLLHVFRYRTTVYAQSTCNGGCRNLWILTDKPDDGRFGFLSTFFCTLRSTLLSLASTSYLVLIIDIRLAIMFKYKDNT